MISLIKKLGRCIKDALRWFCYYWYPVIVAIFALFLTICMIISAVTESQPDDSDPVGGHSGMRVFTDNLTGCQYLGKEGALIPRLTSEGKQICLKK